MGICGSKKAKGQQQVAEPESSTAKSQAPQPPDCKDPITPLTVGSIEINETITTTKPLRSSAGHNDVAPAILTLEPTTARTVAPDLKDDVNTAAVQHQIKAADTSVAAASESKDGEAAAEASLIGLHIAKAAVDEALALLLTEEEDEAIALGSAIAKSSVQQGLALASVEASAETARAADEHAKLAAAKKAEAAKKATEEAKAAEELKAAEAARAAKIAKAVEEARAIEIAKAVAAAQAAARAKEDAQGKSKMETKAKVADTQTSRDPKHTAQQAEARKREATGAQVDNKSKAPQGTTTPQASAITSPKSVIAASSATSIKEGVVFDTDSSSGPVRKLSLEAAQDDVTPEDENNEWLQAHFALKRSASSAGVPLTRKNSAPRSLKRKDSAPRSPRKGKGKGGHK